MAEDLSPSSNMAEEMKTTPTSQLTTNTSTSHPLQGETEAMNNLFVKFLATDKVTARHCADPEFVKKCSAPINLKKISVAERDKAMYQGGYEMNKAEVRPELVAMFEHFDKDGNGVLDVAEEKGLGEKETKNL